MKELLEKMQDTYETFKAYATLQLEKLAKEFRKASLEASKK